MSATEPDPAAEPTAVHDAPTEVIAQDPKESAGDTLPRGRRYAVRTLLVLGTIIGIVALLAVWVNRQALNADNWANTSSSLLQNDEARGQVPNYVVDRVSANVEVPQELEDALPTHQNPPPAPAAGGLQNFAVDQV